MMKLMNCVLLFLILSSIIQMSSSDELNCTFNEDISDNYVRTKKILYSCEVTALENTNNSMIITGYVGKHKEIINDNDVKEIYIHNTNTKYIPANLGSLFNLTKFIMIETELVKIKSNDFQEMEELEDLDLQQNELTFLPLDVITTLTKLEYIYFSNNQIEELANGIFINNLNLKLIDFTNNKIKSIGSEVFDGNKLIYVKLEENTCLNRSYILDDGITRLNEDIKLKCKYPNEIPTTTQRHGEKLECDFNSYHFAMNGFVYSCQVNSLRNRNNKMIINGYTGVHIGIKNDNDVKGINFFSTNTIFIPANLGSLFNLTAFSMRGTKLVEIKSENFHGMQNLEFLELQYNKLTFLPSNAFATLTKLRKLFMIGNHIEELPKGLFDNNINLEIIYFTSNKIKYIHSEIFDILTKIYHVELSDNICFPKDYGSTDIIKIKQDIYLNCRNPNEISTTTTTTTKTTEIPMSTEKTDNLMTNSNKTTSNNPTPVLLLFILFVLAYKNVHASFH